MEIRIGTRRSDLARWQANFVARELSSLFPFVEIRFVYVSSVGDKDRKSEFQQIGGLGVFTKESEDALLAGDVDIVVHSLKDLPTKLPRELVLAAVPKREDARDALCGVNLASLRPGIRVGTGSMRRRAQLLSLCPELKILPIRGNVPPRLRKAKMKEGIDATVLAAAGLSRLGILAEATEILDPEIFPYAVGQGALGIEARRDNPKLLEMLSGLEYSMSRAEVDAERALLSGLGAGCSLPVGVNTIWKNGSIVISAQVTSVDGRQKLISVTDGPASDAISLGFDLADMLLALGAGKILAEVSQ